MIWPSKALSRCKFAMSVGFPADTKVLLSIVLVIGSAITLGALIPLLEISSGLGVLLVLGFLVATTGAFWVLYSGVRGHSWAIGLYFSVVVFTIEATFRRRDLTETGLDAQTLFKLLVWGGSFLIGVMYFDELKRAMQTSNALRWILIFSLWTLLSTIYSITPTYTFGGAFAFVSLICFISTVVQKYGFEKFIMPVIYACGLLTLSAIILYFVMPNAFVAQTEGGRIPRLAGLTGSPNNLGRVASIGLLFIYFAIRSKLLSLRRVDIAMIGLSAVACLGLSWSRTSIIALLLSVGVITLRKRVVLSIWGTTVLLGTLLVLVVADFNWDVLVRLVSRRGTLHELTSFTGRTAIWEYIWGQFLYQPIIGYGYGSTKLLMPNGFRTAMGWTSTSAHNMLLQTLVTTGIIGAFFVSVVLFLQTRYFFKRPNDIADALFVYVLYSGLFEPGAVGVSPNLLTVIWILALVIPREAVADVYLERNCKAAGRAYVS